MVVSLFMRDTINVGVARDRNPTFVTLSDGSVRNAFEVRLRNKHGEPRLFGLHDSGDLAYRLTLEGTPYQAIEVPANETLRLRAYVTAPAGAAVSSAQKSDLRFWVEDQVNGERAHLNSHFTGRGERE